MSDSIDNPRKSIALAPPCLSWIYTDQQPVAMLVCRNHDLVNESKVKTMDDLLSHSNDGDECSYICATDGFGLIHSGPGGIELVINNYIQDLVYFPISFSWAERAQSIKMFLLIVIYKDISMEQVKTMNKDELLEARSPEKGQIDIFSIGLR